MLSDGGRVLCVTALGDGLKDAQDRAYRAVNRIAMQGDTEGKMDDLRRRYPHLDLATWTKEDRLQF